MTMRYVANVHNVPRYCQADCYQQDPESLVCKVLTVTATFLSGVKASHGHPEDNVTNCTGLKVIPVYIKKKGKCFEKG